MRAIKIAAGLACGLTILLFALVFTVKNPETTFYKKTVEILMKQEGLTSEQEIEKCFPKLVDIKSNMGRIADLKHKVLRKIQSPAPVITKEEALQLEYYRQKLDQLRKGVKTELSQLITTYTKTHP